MSIKKIALFFFLLVSFLSCNTENKKIVKQNIKEKSSKTTELSKAQVILNKAIATHGGNLYNRAEYSFVFRNNKYIFKNDGINYKYEKYSQKGDTLIQDILDNNKFSRTINSKRIELSKEDISKYTAALNSVIYFATLPNKLNDNAVNKTYIGETNIKSKDYNIIEITFNEENGGEDHDDEFYYWINKNNNKIDYIAYNYKVNKGGVRFRSAYNTRVIDGITFQDYINYKAEVGTPLKELPKLYEAGKLKELSKIKTENIINLNNKQQ
ncbi:DUF6503 family protein [uncultured Lacinutrix sp.]|uniref:DUF6503 family protein n=1 Tax=uncultured Lacinutrix sp. TaxID=574032 RepID=UPI00261A7631|nr:DUF6503 family protein [uncultured Lacinutrix sp.]